MYVSFLFLLRTKCNCLADHYQYESIGSVLENMFVEKAGWNKGIMNKSNHGDWKHVYGK